MTQAHSDITTHTDRIAEQVAVLIRTARRAAGLTQADLSKYTGIARPNISRAETGRQAPSLITIYKIAKALGVSPGSLVGS